MQNYKTYRRYPKGYEIVKNAFQFTSSGEMNLPNKLVLKAVISCSMSPFLYAKTSTRQEVMRNQDLKALK